MKKTVIDKDTTLSLAVGNIWPILLILVSVISLYFGLSNQIALINQKLDYLVEAQKKSELVAGENDKRIKTVEFDHKKIITLIEQHMGIVFGN